MNRRSFIAMLGSAAGFHLLSARAEQSQARLIAVLEGRSAASAAAAHDAFRVGLHQLGYVEGRNISVEYRYADGSLDRLPALAEELVQLNPKVIGSAPMPANLAVRKATSSIPIVMANAADTVRFGLVRSLSRPGGNVTGLTNFAEDLATKQLDIIRELLPRLMRIGTLVNVENPLHIPQWQETQAAAAKAALALVRFDYHVPEDLERAFDQFAREKIEALLVPPDVTFAAYGTRIAELAAKARLPAIFFNPESVRAGGLMSYGPDLTENYRRAAGFVDKILNGAKPADLPIERPVKFLLAVNLQTAKALGLIVPPTLAARADEVIQ